MRPEHKKILHRLRRLITLDHGQDLVEYALVVALVAFGATASIRSLGSGLANAFNTLSTQLQNDT
jgi:pilus assembly protein Flp/PilA